MDRIQAEGVATLEMIENHPTLVRKQMGHSSAAPTMDIYTLLLNDSKPEAAAKTDAMIFGV